MSGVLTYARATDGGKGEAWAWVLLHSLKERCRMTVYVQASNAKHFETLRRHLSNPRCKVLFALMSPEYFTNKDCKELLKLAVEQRKTVIPLVFGRIRPSDAIRAAFPGDEGESMIGTLAESIPSHEGGVERFQDCFEDSIRALVKRMKRMNPGYLAQQLKDHTKQLELEIEPKDIEEKPFAAGAFGTVHLAKYVSSYLLSLVARVLSL